MKTNLITTLTALLMLVCIGAQAQTDNQTRANVESTDLEGDLNHDGKVDVTDVTYLVNLIMKNQSEAKDGTYYWYIGTENPSSISNIQTDNTVAGWHEIGTSISGFEHNTALSGNEVVLNRDNRVQAYIVIPNELHIYNGLGQRVDDNPKLYAPLECNINGYKAFLIVPDVDFPEGFRTMAGPILKAAYQTKYYWYAGADMLTSETVPGSGTVFPMVTTSEDQIGWHQIKGTPSSIATGSLNNGEQINWVLAVPTSYGLTRISDGEDVTDTYDVSTVTTKDGIEYTVFKQKSATQRTDCAFVEGGTKYYWYIGAENPTSISDIQTDNTIAGWHEIGTSTIDFYLNTGLDENSVVVSTTDRVQYHVVIPNHLHIYDTTNQIVETTEFTQQACNIPGYKSFKINPGDTYNGARTVSWLIIKGSYDY